MASSVQSQIDITGIAAGNQAWSDFEDERSSYKARLAAGIEIEIALPEALGGVRPRKQVSVSVENVAVNTSDVTLADLTAVGSIDGASVTAKLVDLEAGTNLIRFNGSIRQVDEARGTFSIEEVEANMLAQLLPKRRVIDLFPNADLTRGGQDPRIIWVFKELRQVVLVKCQVFNVVGADYGVLRKPTSGTLTLVTVYVNKAVAPSANYTVIDLGSYYVVRFGRLPVDANGQEAEVRVDLTSTEYNRPSDVVKALLSDGTDGLGKGVNNGSFTTAASDYATAGYIAGGGIGPEPLNAGDILNLLCLRGAVLGRNTAGNYTLMVDTAGLHTTSQYNGRPYGLGRGDEHWENIVKVLTKSQKPIEQRINDYTLQGLRTEGFGKEAYLISARSTRGVTGTPKLEVNRFIGDTTTLSKEVGYRIARQAAEENALGLEVDNEARVIGLNETVPVTVPYLRLSTTNPALPWMVRRIVGRKENWELGLVGYDSAQYAATAGTVQSAAAASYLSDFRFTLPGNPTGFFVVSQTMALTGNGTYQLVVTLQATAPNVNVTHLSFRGRAHGSILYQPMAQVECQPGATVQTVLHGLNLGLAYDYVVFAVNVKNDPDFQIGGFAIIDNSLSPNNPTQIGPPGGVTLRAGTGKALQATWPARAEQGVTYNVTLLTNGGSPTLVDANKRGTSWTYADASLQYAVSGSPTYSIQVRTVNPSGVISSTFSTSNTVTLSKVTRSGDFNVDSPWVSGDYGPGSIHDGDVHDVTFGKVTAIAINASTIVTGLLTVNPALNAGATGITITNSGQVEFHMVGSTPSRLAFFDGTGHMLGQITSKPFEVDFDPGFDNDGKNLLLGEAGLRWNAVTVTAVNRFGVQSGDTLINALTGNVELRALSGTTSLYMNGKLSIGSLQVVSAAMPATTVSRIPLYNTNGSGPFAYIPVVVGI